MTRKIQDRFVLGFERILKITQERGDTVENRGMVYCWSGVRVVHPGFFFGQVFLAFEVEAGAHGMEA